MSKPTYVQFPVPFSISESAILKLLVEQILKAPDTEIHEEDKTELIERIKQSPALVAKGHLRLQITLDESDPSKDELRLMKAPCPESPIKIIQTKEKHRNDESEFIGMCGWYPLDYSKGEMREQIYGTFDDRDEEMKYDQIEQINENLLWSDALRYGFELSAFYYYDADNDDMEILDMEYGGKFADNRLVFDNGSSVELN